MWKCKNCGSTSSERPNFCKKCGLVQAGIGTHEKYQILEEYCHPLSLIMRNKHIDHYFIDACAGSGIVQAYYRDEYLDGSPLIMVKTKNWVQETIKNKSKPKQAKCIFIEVNPEAFNLLEKHTCDFAECERILGDCNNILPEVLNRLDGEKRKPFTFIYIDPFGLGDPPIKMETLRRVLERDYTELFIQFTADGLIRTSGWLKHLDSQDPQKRMKAKSYHNTLRCVIGNDRIQEYYRNWFRWREGEKETKAFQYYISGLRDYFQHVEYIGIPVGSARPVYYLIYTSRNETGKKIMQYIILKAKRKGSEDLTKWM